MLQIGCFKAIILKKVYTPNHTESFSGSALGCFGWSFASWVCWCSSDSCRRSWASGTTAPPSPASTAPTTRVTMKRLLLWESWVEENEWNLWVYRKCLFYPFSKEALVSTQYASAILLFVRQLCIKGYREKKKIGFTSEILGTDWELYWLTQTTRGGTSRLLIIVLKQGCLNYKKEA